MPQSSDRSTPVCPRCDGALVAPPPDRPGSWVCAGCAGVWLESAAFARLCEELTAARPEERAGPAAAEPRCSLCPACGSPMGRHDVGGSRGISLDVCRHGVWLDAGGVDALRRLGRTDDLVRLEAEQRLAPILERRRRGPTLFAHLSVDADPDPRDGWAVDRVLRALLDLLGDLLHFP